MILFDVLEDACVFFTSTSISFEYVAEAVIKKQTRSFAELDTTPD